MTNLLNYFASNRPESPAAQLEQSRFTQLATSALPKPELLWGIQVSSNAFEMIRSLTRLAKTCILHAADVSTVPLPVVLSSSKFCEHAAQQVQHLISGLPERVSRGKSARALGQEVVWKSLLVAMLTASIKSFILHTHTALQILMSWKSAHRKGRTNDYSETDEFRRRACEARHTLLQERKEHSSSSLTFQPVEFEKYMFTKDFFFLLECQKGSLTPGFSGNWN